MTIKVKPHPRFPNVYRVRLNDGSQRLATENLTPTRKVYGERLVKREDAEYRIWDPFRSKLAAAIVKNIKTVPIKPGHKVLYLGAASGTTVSHISDIVGARGHVYCVEFAPRSMRELVNNVCSVRHNISPILEDARRPDKYKIFIPRKVDAIYCDVAQPEQAKILADNAEIFLKKLGWIMLTVKSQSIDVTKKPTEIYRREIKVLKRRGFDIQEVLHLEPYDKAHAMIVAKKPSS
ncbi:MAG: fibrillarin-like rRNA/tRNA 2'-O-methyltransferase [Thermoproteota archaeon]